MLQACSVRYVHLLSRIAAPSVDRLGPDSPILPLPYIQSDQAILPKNPAYSECEDVSDVFFHDAMKTAEQ